MKQKGAAYKGAVFARVQMGKMLFWILACLMACGPNLPVAQAAAGNGKIVFYSNRDGNDEIYIMNSDGTNQTRLTNNSAQDEWPQFSPDGRKIAFESKRDGNKEIYIMNADGTNQTRLTNNAADDIQPFFTPDGSKIAFASKRDGDFEICAMNVDGSNFIALTNNTVKDVQPRYSPDGSKIVFFSDLSGNDHIYLMNADGSSRIRLTFNTGTNWNPAFSPDGSKIAYSCALGGYFQIFTMNADGSNQVRLTNLQATSLDYMPRYSPDGTKIVFASTRNSTYCEIFSMNVDGSQVTQLTTNLRDDQMPAWGAVVLPTLSIANVALPEGSATTPGSATFTVTLSPATTQTVTVNYTTADGTAAIGSDYIGKNGTVSFAPGETSKTITVNFLGDSNAEGDETFFVNLSQPTNAALSVVQGVGVIVNDDAVVPSLSIADVTANEGSASAPGSATFTVTLSPSVSQSVSVNYATINGSATAESDYGAQSGVLTFEAGETSKTLTVNFVGDAVQEVDESFAVNLSQATGAVINRTQATGTILNDDAGPLPSMSINDVTVTEGNTGVVNAVFTVTLSQAATQSISVDFAVTNNSATAPSDFTIVNGTLSFTPGEMSKTISVPVRSDTLDEPNETFRVVLSNVVNALLSDAQGQGTIQDDDLAPSISVEDVSVFEGNSSAVNATFTIMLSAASGQTVSVNAITSNGTAKAPGDFTSGGAQLSFAPGERSKTFVVPVQGDLLNEADEVFYVFLSSAVNASVARGRAVATIFDNDVVPSVSVEGVSIGEGNSGQRTASFRLKLSAPSGRLVKVSYATTEGSATPGSDYVAVAPSQVSFAVGSQYAYARVLINGDLLNELDESLGVTLSQPVNASLANSQATGVILNDDRAPSLSINDVSVAEGNAGTKTLSFTVSLSAPSGQIVNVKYATADGMARLTSDYVSANGALSFAPGETTKTVAVMINGDALVEGDETMFVFLSGATNASISRARGTGIIQNDDASG